MTEIVLLLTAFLFGGMTLYSFGFAAFLLNVLPAETARPVIRKAFPHFYLFVFCVSGIAGLGALIISVASSLILGAIALTTVFARQVLMPMINTATDAGDRRQYRILHTIAVLLTVLHIIGAGVVLIWLAA